MPSRACLRGKTRVLATHQLHMLHRCDRVVWMVDGQIEAVGTYAELMEGNASFAELMASTSIDEGGEEREGQA